MDIDGVGALFLNSSIMNDAVVNRAKNNADAAVKFEQLLKKPEAAAQETSSSRYAVIDKDSKLYEQCVELEIFMVKTLITGMRNTIQKSGLIEEGFAGKMYEDMLYDEYTRDFTVNSKFGMADMAYLELSGQKGKLLPAGK